MLKLYKKDFQIEGCQKETRIHATRLVGHEEKIRAKNTTKNWCLKCNYIQQKKKKSVLKKLEINQENKKVIVIITS